MAKDRIRLKRVYDAASDDDGHRVLVERLWPRGLSKDRARVDTWLKEIAPSTELRKWYGHDPKKWDEFQRRYRHELDERPDAVVELEKLTRSGPVTFVFAARDEEHNSAVVLRAYLEERRARS